MLTAHEKSIQYHGISTHVRFVNNKKSWKWLIDLFMRNSDFRWSDSSSEYFPILRSNLLPSFVCWRSIQLFSCTLIRKYSHWTYWLLCTRPRIFDEKLSWKNVRMYCDGRICHSFQIIITKLFGLCFRRNSSKIFFKEIGKKNQKKNQKKNY